MITTASKNPENKKVGFFSQERTTPSIMAIADRGYTYTVNITQDFGDANTFDEVVHLLLNANEQDDIVFNINSCGGNLFSLVALQNAIQSTRARYHMVLLGEAASAAGALF